MTECDVCGCNKEAVEIVEGYKRAMWFVLKVCNRHAMQWNLIPGQEK